MRPETPLNKISEWFGYQVMYFDVKLEFLRDYFKGEWGRLCQSHNER